LDGVRGLAILLVIGFHSRIVFASAAEIPTVVRWLMNLGWSGVDLFFVLSGFLITGILLESRESSSFFRTFYFRRVLRIFPLYYFYLFVVLVVLRGAWVRFEKYDPWAATGGWWYVSYLMNWKSDTGLKDGLLDHLWSLAIEEQFYLVWPAIVWLTPRRKLTWVCAGIAAGALAVRCWLGAGDMNPDILYRLTPARLDSLAVGAFLAVAVRDFPAAINRWIRRLVGPAVITFLVAARLSPNPLWADRPMQMLGASALALLCGCVVHSAATAESGPLRKFFSGRMLRNFGKHSYAMYVMHAIPWELTALRIHYLSSAQLPRYLLLALKYSYFPGLVAVAYGLSLFTWALIERQFLRLKRHFPYVASKFEHDPAEMAAVLQQTKCRNAGVT
jgi:peptidoglycan/LPS O-acetylase OafA/YrhL